MKKTLFPADGWHIAEAAAYDAFLSGTAQEEPRWLTVTEPTSVQDALIQAGELPEYARTGQLDIGWVSRKDWIYRATIPCPQATTVSSAALVLNGVDTIADICFNGSLVAQHNDIYLRARIDVTHLLREENEILIRFYSPDRYIEQATETMPEAWQDWINPVRLLRKANQDYGFFLGNRYICACVGLYDEAFLEVYDSEDKLLKTEVSYIMPQTLESAALTVAACADGAAGAVAGIEVFDPDGACICSATVPVENGRIAFQTTVESPRLWWPNRCGDQPLYRVRVSLRRDGTLQDTAERRVGFRRIEYYGNFDFRINNRKIRLYGSNWINVDGVTHWCDRDRVRTLVDYAVEGNFNTLRVWGEAPLMPDLLYDLADERGLLVWQDFGLGFGPWPDSEPYRVLFRQEVTQMVERLKGHTCLFLWCGSNETYMTNVSAYRENHVQAGLNMIFEDAPKILAALDPDRPYIPSSPMGGKHPQEASAGDMHGYWGIFFEPGIQYPNLFSESCHVTTYSPHSMRRFMTEEELWPAGYHDTNVYRFDFSTTQEVLRQPRRMYRNHWRQVPIPPTWEAHMSPFAASDLWNIERYFDAADADSLIYKFAACGADFYKEEIERIRRGHRCADAFALRQCQGYLTWKYNDAFPHINFTQIDYYLEPTPQYYAVRRAFAPLLVGTACEEQHLYLFAINDSMEQCSGNLVLRIFSRGRNRVEKEIVYPVHLQRDEARIVACLDDLCPLHRELILHTALLSESGEQLASNIHYLDIERNLAFPQARLSLRYEDGALLVTTDQYARWVELVGDADGDCFGFQFSDNYFDLLPFETKRVEIRGRHAKGTVTARARYSPHSAQTTFRRDV